jgi:hypothetical protein
MANLRTRKDWVRLESQLIKEIAVGNDTYVGELIQRVCVHLPINELVGTLGILAEELKVRGDLPKEEGD